MDFNLHSTAYLCFDCVSNWRISHDVVVFNNCNVFILVLSNFFVLFFLFFLFSIAQGLEIVNPQAAETAAALVSRRHRPLLVLSPAVTIVACHVPLLVLLLAHFLYGGRHCVGTVQGCCSVLSRSTSKFLREASHNTRRRCP